MTTQNALTIDLTLAAQNMGPLADDESNEAYAAAVIARLHAAYPGSTVEVDWDSTINRDRVSTSLPAGDEDDQIVETVLSIAQDVFNGGRW
jgi:hypothetical protein